MDKVSQLEKDLLEKPQYAKLLRLLRDEHPEVWARISTDSACADNLGDIAQAYLQETTWGFIKLLSYLEQLEVPMDSNGDFQQKNGNYVFPQTRMVNGVPMRLIDRFMMWALQDLLGPKVELMIAECLIRDPDRGQAFADAVELVRREIGEGQDQPGEADARAQAEREFHELAAPAVGPAPRGKTPSVQ